MARLVESLERDRVRANLESVRGEIAQACERAGRDRSSIELLAATKYVPDELMGELAEAGVTLVGENTSASLEAKHDHWGDRFTYDFIGHLQSRKVKDVLPLVRLIHSVESESVLRRIEQHATEPAELLLEVNVAGEQTKQGVALNEVEQFLDLATGFEKARFVGLMTMPPYTDDPEHVRPHFAALRELSRELAGKWSPRYSFDVLSMGTSQDYAVAVEEGASIVRLGSVLYR